MRHFLKELNVVFFLFSICLLAEGQPIRFQRTYGFFNHDFLQSKQTSDGGFILFGEKNYNDPTSSILVIKTDSGGFITWAKTYSTPSDFDYTWDIESFTNYYLICASAQSPALRYFIKIDLTGNVVWMKTNILATHVVRTASDGFVFLGTGGSGSLTKMDSNFNIIWRKKYDILNLSNSNALKKTLDGGFIIAGDMFGYNGNLDFNLIRTDSLGNILWAKMYGGTNNEWFPEVEQTFDGGYIMVGSTESYGVGGQDAILIKLDAVGTVQWTKTFGGTMTDAGNFVKPTFGSIGYIISGNTDGFSVSDDSAYWGNSRTFLLKTDINGNFQWARRYGLGPQDNASTVWQTQDAGYAFSGSTGTFGVGGLDGWLIKTDNMGLSGCYDWATIPMITSPTILDSVLTWTESNDTLTIGTGTLFDSVVTPFTTIECLSGPNGLGVHDVSTLLDMTINIYPNPSSGKFQIESSEAKIQNVEVYNMFGEKIYSVGNSSFMQTAIDLSAQPAGIYFVRVNTKTGAVSKKIIKE